MEFAILLSATYKTIFFGTVTSAAVSTPPKFKPFFFLRLTTPKVERKWCTIFTDNYILAHSSMYSEDNIQVFDGEATQCN